VTCPVTGGQHPCCRQGRDSSTVRGTRPAGFPVHPRLPRRQMSRQHDRRPLARGSRARRGTWHLAGPVQRAPSAITLGICGGARRQHRRQRPPPLPQPRERVNQKDIKGAPAVHAKRMTVADPGGCSLPAAAPAAAGGVSGRSSRARGLRCPRFSGQGIQ